MSAVNIAGLTDEQTAAVEAATQLTDPWKHDGLVQVIATALGAGDSFTNEEVMVAIGTALVNYSGIYGLQVLFSSQ